MEKNIYFGTRLHEIKLVEMREKRERMGGRERERVKGSKRDRETEERLEGSIKE